MALKGLEAWKQWCPHLIVLDLMLPGIDGMQILKNIRLEDERLPILILSAKVEPSDRVDGFLDGVDDYMTKPFSLEEFLLRVKRLLTRDQWQREQDDSLKTPIQLNRNRTVLERTRSIFPAGRPSVAQEPSN